jgi:uncharacterized membrane protein YcaP (DUF421 family)
VGQFTIYDLVLILVVANAVQPAMTGPDTSLLGGLIIIATLVVLNLVVARLDAFHRFFSASPTVVIKDGRSLEPDGTISIVPKDGQTIRSKRRVRYRRF